MLRSNTWKKHFQQLRSNKEADKKLQSYSSALAFDTLSGTSEEELFRNDVLKQLTEDQDTIILGVSQVSNKMKLFHSFSNLGGTRIREENKLVALEGFGPTATAVLLNESDINSPQTIKVPSYTQLKSCSDPSTVGECPASTTGREMFKNAPVIIIPPFVANAFIEMASRDPSQLLVETLSLINAFDARDDTEESNKAKNHCKYILKFLWAAAHSEIPTITMVPDADDEELQRWSSICHENCILQLVPEGLPPPSFPSEMMQSLATSIRHSATVMENFREDKATASSKKEKFKNLHESAKKLILNASSISGESTPESPVESCTNFFSKSSLSQAKELLTISLEEDYGCCVELQDGLVSALYAGHFSRDRADIPSNFSVFLVPKKSPLSYDYRSSNLILQLKLKHGKTLEEGEMKDLVKQGIRCPDSIDTLIHHLQNTWGLASFFFGRNSIVARRIMPVIEAITRNVLTYEHCQLRDSHFATKLGYAIDTRIFRWLQQCMRREDRESVDDRMINFEPILSSVLTDSFYQELPLAIIEASKDKDESPEEDIFKPRKKTRKISGEKEKVINEKPSKEWKLNENENYTDIFAGKNIDKRPILKGKRMCIRFHVKGYCFKDCANTCTHIPSRDINKNTASEFSEFVNLCRA